MGVTPLTQRVSATDDAPKGYLVNSGVVALREALAGNASAFADWRRGIITRRVVGAMQDLLMHMPASLAAQDALVQYGVTQGLALAIQLCNDPALLWPGVFGNVSDKPSGTLPDMEYETSLDDALKS